MKLLSFCFLIVFKITMAQTFTLNNEGLSELPIGSNINMFKFVKPLQEHPNKSAFCLGFEDEFKYYYIDEKAMIFEGNCQINYIFTIPDENNIINSVIIYVKDSNQIMTKKIENIFGKAPLKSESSIDSIKTNSKTFWQSSNGITILLTKYFNSNLNKIEIFKIPLENHTPSVSFF